MTTVTLITGEQVDSASEEWRLETEARELLRKGRTTAFRRDYLANVERSRGTDAANKLRELVLKIWEGNKR